jgi:EmrB/QacA subfamily drug resistance transporter
MTIASSVPSPTWRALALLVAGAFFMENLDGTIIVTATDRMARSFHVPAADLNVTIAAYLLTLGVLIPVSGWVADRFGTRTVFATAITIFTTASALCALSTSLEELTVTRVLQGLGGAMMVPVGRLVVLRASEKRDIIKAIAYLTWPALAAPVIAPAVGGVLTTYASWRWIFIINLPLGAIALYVTIRTVPNMREAERTALDWRGFLLTGAGLATFVGGIEGATDGATWGLALAAVSAGAVLIVVAVAQLRRTQKPLLDLSLFSLPTFRVTNAGGSCFRMAIGAAPFLLPLLFQEAFGWSAFKAGLIVVPLFLGNIGIKPLTTPILHRFKFKTVLVTSCMAATATLALCATFSATTPLVLVVVVLLLSGTFRSIGFTAFNTIVFADVPQERMSSANTLTSTVQQLTMGLGVAVGALALSAGGPIARALGGTGTGRAPFVVAFALVACLPLLAAAESVSLERRAGSALTAPGAS